MNQEISFTWRSKLVFFLAFHVTDGVAIIQQTLDTTSGFRSQGLNTQTVHNSVNLDFRGKA